MAMAQQALGMVETRGLTAAIELKQEDLQQQSRLQMQ